MSKNIHKADFSKVIQEKIPYTIHMNQVIQNVKDCFSLGLWCYLSTLPPDWGVNKEHLKSHFKVGRDKINQSLKYLFDLKLISYDQKRIESGKFSVNSIIVSSGMSFIEYLNNNQQHNTAALENRSTDLPGNGKTTTTKEIILTKENKDKIDHFCKRAKIAKNNVKNNVSRDFTFTQDHNVLADELGLNIKTELSKFIDYYSATGKKMIDWNAAFRNWLRNAYEYKTNKTRGYKKSFSEQYEDIVRECLPVKQLKQIC